MNTYKHWAELVRMPEKYASLPTQLLHDMLCAIRSFEHIDDDLFLDDFEWTFCGPKKIEELLEYDSGLFSWLELAPSSSLNDFKTFRGYQWMCKASKWFEIGVPPIVAIQLNDRKQIGDGRGRVNFANMVGYEVPLYFMRFKNEATV